jgi:hypothetical protein
LHVGDVILQFIFVTAVLLLGGSLFWLRTTYRRVYAITEIIVGVLAATYASNELLGAATSESRAKAIFASLGGLYIIVRGFDNWSQATTPKAPL